MFVDAPVSGSKGPAEQRRLLILASGSAAAAGWVGPVFGILGRKTVWLGEAGQGSQVKLAAGRGRQDISAARLALASGSPAS
jgi:3-hydroxyisobutyrate dehydrogenase